MDCTVWNERHRTRLAFRRPGAGAHRDIERGKVPSVTTPVSPFLYCFTMSWWVGGSLRTCSFLFFSLGAAAATKSVLKQSEVPATGSSFYVSVLYTATLRTPTAAVVHGCLYFCPLDCDASVMVVDCAAVKMGCMLEKYIPAEGLQQSTCSFLFFGRGVAAAAAACCCCCPQNQY